MTVNSSNSNFRTLISYGPTFSVNSGESVYYEFTSSSKIEASQTIRVYYSLKEDVSSNLTNIINSNFVYVDESGEPTISNRNLVAPVTGGWSDSGTYGEIGILGTAGCVWNEWPISGETDEFNLTVGNTYWYRFTPTQGYDIDETGSNRVAVFRDGDWVILTTTGKITWTSVI
jgi:hypothetical protein